MTPVLRLENLYKSYGALRVTDGVSLEVYPGECHALIGPNGAGKTTLIHQIAGSLKIRQWAAFVCRSRYYQVIPTAAICRWVGADLSDHHADPAVFGAGECSR